VHHGKPTSKRTIVLMHENAGNIGMRLDMVQSLYTSLDSNIVIIGYRGYGHSTCEPSEEGLMIDGKRIIEYVFQNHMIDHYNVYMLGPSMGGAVSLYTSPFFMDKLKGLILLNTFTSLPDVVDSMNIIFRIFRPIVLSNFWPSNERIVNNTLPMLFISGRKDTMIPPSQMDKLFELAVKSKHKSMYKVEDGEHNDTWFLGGFNMLKEINDFMKLCDRMLQKPKVKKREDIPVLQKPEAVSASQKQKVKKREDISVGKKSEAVSGTQKPEVKKREDVSVGKKPEDVSVIQKPKVKKREDIPVVQKSEAVSARQKPEVVEHSHDDLLN
jgi:fermentation-respiration switch protein FrsA (DUF1100 family)